jgi:hypothetical protein
MENLNNTLEEIIKLALENNVLNYRDKTKNLEIIV